MKKPNFFITGAPKCGTTSMARWLAEHLNIYMSPVKEPNFFNTDDQWTVTRTLRQYEALFPKRRPRTCHGRRSFRVVFIQLGMLERNLGIQKGLGVLNTLYRANVRVRKRPPLDGKMWQRLAEYFEEDIKKLSRLMGRDFSYWLAFPGDSKSTKPGEENG